MSPDRQAAEIDDRRRARFREIYEANHARILGYARRRTDANEAALDVVSDTFLVAWRRIDEIPDGDRARLWLYGVARRTLGNHHRSMGRHRNLTSKLRGLAPPPEHPALPGDGPDRSAVATAFARLAANDRELLLLVGWEGLDAAEMAEVLGCTPSTARVRLHRARQRFARSLAAEGLQQDGSPGHVEGRRAAARPEVKDVM